jgi:hypothetical protein
MVTTTALESHGLALNPPGRVNSRPVEEIISELNTHIPVTSERNVWMFWDTGFEGIPAWIRRSVVNCVRRQATSWTVRLLDVVPSSPNHVLRFVSEADFPAAFKDGRMLRKDGRQHVSDFARLAVVFRVRCPQSHSAFQISLTETAWRHLHGCRNNFTARFG